MPEQKAPQQVEIFSPDSLPFRFAPDPMSDAMALSICQQTFWLLESWRSTNHDQRWRSNDELYYGRVMPRYWEGTTIQRSSVAVQKAAQVVDAACAKIEQEVIEPPDILQVSPEFGASPENARLIRDRLLHILDHNIDDYGWTVRAEASLALKDDMMYGNCYGLVDYDHIRRQAVILRLDPRDVWVDPACPSPYIEAARTVIVRRVVTISDVMGWKDVPGFNVPPKDILYWLAKNRRTLQNENYALKGGWRGERYTPADDRFVVDPAYQNLNLYIHFSHGREIWTLDNQWVLFNKAYPYGCMRVVSAPCIPIPNRHYAESLVDRSETVQQVATTLLNWHVDETSLAMNPPRVQKAGMTGTPAQNAWRPNAVIQSDNPKENVIFQQPAGITRDVWQTLGYLDQENQKATGLSSLAIAGMPTPSNANRTSAGIGQQLAGSDGRLAPIAKLFETYFLVPALYKCLKVEAQMSRNSNGY